MVRQSLHHLVDTHYLGHEGFHRREHWLRVLQNGREIATATDANLKVVELFAVIHDSKRENEGYDPDHGALAAAYAKALQGEWFDVTASELNLLCEACRYHSEGFTAADLTVQACWDADRLDLGPVGIKPDPRLLCTDYAKQPEVLTAAHERSLMSR